MDVIDSMLVADLKRELRARGLSVSGRKQELKDRLILAIHTEQPEEQNNDQQPDQDQDDKFTDFDHQNFEEFLDVR